MYIKIISDVPTEYAIGKLRKDNPDISFPKNISNDILATFDIYPYTQEQLPIIDEKTQKIKDGGFEKKETGDWIKKWNVVENDQDEINAWIAAKEVEVREKRNTLLGVTDFYALSDNNMSPEMAAYRQALRDITTQIGFPENVIWPEKP